MNHNRIYMNTLITLLLVIFLAPVIASAAVAKTQTAAERSSQATDNQTAKVSDLKARANQEIDRRVTSLNKLVTKVDNIKKLSDAGKTDIKSQIQQNIADLTTLRTKIAGDTDLVTLKADVKSIVDSYRIYLLFVPKVHILTGADVATTITTKLDTIYAKLETKIATAETAGNDVASLKTTLADMKAKIAETNTDITAAVNTVTPLEPSSYPGNKSSLQSARVSLKNAHAAIVAARKDANTIVNGLKEFNKTTSTTGTSAQ